MLLTETQHTSEAPQAGSAGRFALRVCNQAEEHLVDLPYGRTTIGTSPRCNVRIQQPGVHPLHCLVVCGSDGMTVRRWAADTLLNGEPFEDASLAAGDHLSLGPVDLEVVNLSAIDERAEYATDPIAEQGEKIASKGSSDCCPTNTSAESEEETANGQYAAPENEHSPFSWGQDTIHHTTVWVGEDEGESVSEPAEHPEVELEYQGELQVMSSAEVVPAEAAREVFRQLQESVAISRARCRKLIQSLRANRDAHRDQIARADGLTNTKDELVAEFEAVARERNMLREQLATAERRYAEWDHQSHQREVLQKEWDVARAEWDNQRKDWDQQRAEWTRQVDEGDSRLAGYVHRSEELEGQLAETHTNEAKPPEATFATPSADVEASHGKQGATELTSARQENSESGEAQVPTREQEAPAEPPAWERHTPAWEDEPPSWEVHTPTPNDETPAGKSHSTPPSEEDLIEPIKPETDTASAVQPVVPSSVAA
ncbi:MAG: FHA domain-containing protein, partial [Pirellulales bacterium]